MGKISILQLLSLYVVSMGNFLKKVFYAKHEGDLEKQIHEYLVDYYGEGNTFEIHGNVYYYWHGEVAVKNHGWEEITELGQLVNKLL